MMEKWADGEGKLSQSVQTVECLPYLLRDYMIYYGKCILWIQSPRYDASIAS